MDETKRPLLIPPEFGSYAQKHGLFDMIKYFMEQLIINRPKEPLLHLINLIEKDVNEIPRILILGPPASGKTTIANLVHNKLRTVFIKKENLVAEASPEYRHEADTYISQGEEVPISLLVKIIKERLTHNDCVNKGWLIEGFPDNRKELLSIMQEGILFRHCVILNAPDVVLIERAVGKRVDPRNGDIYHTTFNWPNDPEVLSHLEEVSGCTEPEMVDKLILYRQNEDGLYDCVKKFSKIINADQPEADVFSQSLSFLSTRFRSPAPHTPRIVLLGPPGSGKHLQASLLTKKYGIVNVSCGHLLKQAIMGETKAGLATLTYIEKDMLVPDNTVLSIIKDRLLQLDCMTRGWVLHGYPKSREQAEQLSKLDLTPTRVIFLNIPIETSLERLEERATDPITGKRYHLLYDPPKSQTVRKRLCQHPKDEEESIRRKFNLYQIYVEEINDYFVDAIHLNADQDPHTVFECIENTIVNPLPFRFS